MDLLKEIITIDRENDRSIYLQITNGFIRNIRRGRLRKGLKLPGSRKLAKLLNINRMTVVSAYDELEAQGWIESIPRKGTFITKELPDIKPSLIDKNKEMGHFPDEAPFPIDESRVVSYPSKTYRSSKELIIDDGFPDIRLAPIEALTRKMQSITGTPVFIKYLTYGDPKGTEVLRETLAVHLSDTRGLPITKENVMITQGAQMGINLATSLLIQPGDHIIEGSPGYFGADRAFQQHQAVIEEATVDDKGIDVDAVERLCKEKQIQLLYVIPHHHYPTTVTLTPERRIKLLELAEKYNFAIIEDDYDYYFHYSSRPMLPMASLDHYGSVIYIGTLSKTLAPSIRIGYVVAAKNVIEKLANLRRTMDMQGNSLLEMAIAELYKNGTMKRHIRKSVKLYHKRRDHFCDLLKKNLDKHVSFTKPDGGMAVWTEFVDTNLKKLSNIAYKKGLIIGDGKEFNTSQINAIRMGFASLNLEEQEKTVDTLTECLKNG